MRDEDQREAYFAMISVGTKNEIVNVGGTALQCMHGPPELLEEVEQLDCCAARENAPVRCHQR